MQEKSYQEDEGVPEAGPSPASAVWEGAVECVNELAWHEPHLRESRTQLLEHTREHC